MKTLTTVFSAMIMLMFPVVLFGHTPLDGPEGDTFYGDPSNMQSHANWKTDIRDNGVLLDWNFLDHSGVRLEGNHYAAHTHDTKPDTEPKSSKRVVSTPAPVPVPVMQVGTHFVSEPEPKPEPESAQQVARSSPRITSIPVVPNLISIPPASVYMTEIMFRDWPSGPQWFEIYNSGSDTNLEGYMMVFHEQVHRRRRTPIDDVVVIFGSFELQSGDVAIIAKNSAHRLNTSGVVADQVYINPEILNLKGKWSLFDANNQLIFNRNSHWNHQIGGHNEARGRISQVIIPTEPPKGMHYYGWKGDTSTPGHHETVVAAAPSLQKPKLITMWAELKKQ